MALPHARRRLSPEFVQAVLASPITNHRLALRSGWPQGSGLSTLLHSQYVVASPTNVLRVRLLAALIGFAGELFGDELPAARRDGFTADTMPRAR